MTNLGVIIILQLYFKMNSGIEIRTGIFYKMTSEFASK
jgi:hypothetical protein